MSPALDHATCVLLTARASFAPARDASGNFAPGRFRSRVKWVLPYYQRAAQIRYDRDAHHG